MALLIQYYSEKNEFNKAKEFIEKGNEIIKEIPKSIYNINFMVAVANFYDKKGDIKEAINFAEKALNYNPNIVAKIDIWLQIANLYLKAKDEKAKEFAKKSLMLAKKINSIHHLWKANYYMYKITNKNIYLQKYKHYLNEQFNLIPKGYLTKFKKHIIKKYKR